MLHKRDEWLKTRWALSVRLPYCLALNHSYELGNTVFTSYWICAYTFCLVLRLTLLVIHVIRADEVQ